MLAHLKKNGMLGLKAQRKRHDAVNAMQKTQATCLVSLVFLADIFLRLTMEYILFFRTFLLSHKPKKFR